MRITPERLIGRVISLSRLVTAWASWWCPIQLDVMAAGPRKRRHVVLHAPRFVRICEQVSLSKYVQGGGGDGMPIGDRVLIAAYFAITSQTHRVELAPRQENVLAPVVIEDDNRIGTHAAILPGVTDGCGVVDGVGAVVTHDVSPSTVAIGVPARSVASSGA